MCPPEVCGARERAVRWRLYAASTAAAADVGESEPDIVLEYEYSVTPELIVYTDVEHPVTGVRQLVVLAKRLEQDVSTRPEHAERRPT